MTDQQETLVLTPRLPKCERRPQDHTNSVNPDLYAKAFVPGLFGWVTFAGNPIA
jgi:hypothetical protein